MYFPASAVPCLATILDSLLPCSKLIFAVVLPVVPAPAVRASRTRTCFPDLASSTAVISPVMPAPTTTASAVELPGSEVVGVGDRSASHNDVMDGLYPAPTRRNGADSARRTGA